MKTWNDYKEYVRTVDPETAKDIKETEEVAAIVTAINKTFEGQLKQSKPFSYRRFSWLTLCGCQARNKKNLQKNKPYKGFSRFRTDLSLVGLTCALYVLFLIMIMLHGHPFCYAAD